MTPPQISAKKERLKCFSTEAEMLFSKDEKKFCFLNLIIPLCYKTGKKISDKFLCILLFVIILFLASFYSMSFRY